MPDIQARLHDIQYDVIASSPEQFGAWIRTEITRWGKVVKSSGAKVG
jgi:tripartite-type tricarboxylate transporter receptor subunit TctC